MPPPNYVAGLSRGATGFTTRFDISLARTIGDAEPLAVKDLWFSNTIKLE